MYRTLLFAAAFAVLLAACDTSITGEQLENQAPNTRLSVHDTSLVENLGGNMLTSTVHISWSGSDPDGYVNAFDFRYYEVGGTSGEEQWTRTQRRDSLILLPIPRGASTAQVVFEVRAIDDAGVEDPEPARTIFPIKNSPPDLQLSPFVEPPDTSFNIFSFGWTSSDPDGVANLDRVEVSFNDTTSFTSLPPDVEFVSFVADFDRSNTGPYTTSARVYTGRGFASTSLRVPGLRLNDDNVLYVRAIDATDTTSTLRRYPTTDTDTWYVRAPTSRILFVNDYRLNVRNTIIDFHLEALKGHLPAGNPIDVWDLSQPYATSSAGNLAFADALPSTPNPTLRPLFAQWDFIYWVSDDVTSSIAGKNLALAAPHLDDFFQSGGRMFVHTPIKRPSTGGIEDNPATLLLPLSDLPAIPDSIVRIQLAPGAIVSPFSSIPGTDETLPRLVMQDYDFTATPFHIESNSVTPLYAAQYTTRSGEPWTGASTVAAITNDRRLAHFALPIVDDQSGELLLTGPGGDSNAAPQAIQLILEALGFPQ